MTLACYSNGKVAEELVKSELKKIGCYVDDLESFMEHWHKLYLSSSKEIAKHFFRYPFQFKSQKGIKREIMQQKVDKIPDFSSLDYFIEVKSIDNNTTDLKLSNKKLIGEIIYEYKQYEDYLNHRKYKRSKEYVYYVLIGNCDKDLVMSYLKNQNSWHWMSERFSVVTLNELLEVFSRKIEIYNSTL